jgi:hypothetical protein
LADIDDAGSEVSQGHATEIQRKRLQIQRHLVRLRKMQTSFMPVVSEKLLEGAGQTSLEVEREKLWFPSKLSNEERSEGRLDTLSQLEVQLRQAQCLDALDTIRSIERAKIAVVSYRNKNSRGQTANTRIQTVFSTLARRSKLAAHRYRRARIALLAIVGDGAWTLKFKELHDTDIRGPGNDFSDGDNYSNGRRKKRKKLPAAHRDGGERLGEGSRTTSWIWTVTGTFTNSDAGLQEGKFSL